jgi:type III pantothenate kinase
MSVVHSHIIVVDIGNTQTTIGLAGDDRVHTIRRLPSNKRSMHAVNHCLKSMLRSSRPGGVIISSVVPSRNAMWIECCRRMFSLKPVFVSHKLKLGIDIHYPRPEKIGADRLANAAAAAHRYGTPVVVTDFGTALTFDIVSSQGRYEGGIIAPGLPLMTEYLADKTALLPRIKLSKTNAIIGKSTREAMCIGSTIGYRGMVREILSELRKELGKGLTVCATGGYAELALEGIKGRLHIDQDLTLYGLYRIFILNQ